ncbi:MAG TPA: phosphodiester glycosidase family protein, partial [Thermoproteota archaeon]|nr:phosphodiester glycosidase family protein [Thermoproteota archaeon]
VANSLRRIAAAGTGSVRGSVTRDDVLVVSRSSGERDLSQPFFKKDDGTLLSRDSIEFTLLQDSVRSGRLTTADASESSAFRMSGATHLEKEILGGLMSQDRMLYSVRSATRSSRHVRQAYVRVEPTLPIGFASHYESLPDICVRRGALAGINGGFFANFPEELSLHTVFNDPVNSLVIDGHMRCSPSLRRGAFVVSTGGSASIEITDPCSLSFLLGGRRFSGAKSRRDQQSVRFDVNQASRDGAALYNGVSGSNSPPGRVVDFVVGGDLVVEVKKGGGARIPQSGFVLQITDSQLSKEIFANLLAKRGANRLRYELHSDHAADGVRQAVAAGPVLVRDGVTLKPDYLLSDLAVEEFQRGKLVPTRLSLATEDAKTRAPRSAVGITNERHVLFVTVDDDREVDAPREQRRSIGATLSELSEIMRDLDCSEALNLDGGGSSTLWMDGEVRNRPSDGFARAVPDALLVLPVVDG